MYGLGILSGSLPVLLKDSPVWEANAGTHKNKPCAVFAGSLSNSVPFSVTAHVELTAVLWFSCPSCIPALEATVSFKHWRIKTKPWLEVYWGFLRGVFTGEVVPKGKAFSSVMSCFFLGMGPRRKWLQKNVLIFILIWLFFYLQIPQKILWSEKDPSLSSVMDLVLLKICWEILEVHWFKCSLW